LHEEIKYLVDHLVGNDMDTLHEERIHLLGFNFIRVIDMEPVSHFLVTNFLISNQILYFKMHIYSQRNILIFFLEKNLYFYIKYFL
jgi:hypothetical protein